MINPSAYDHYLRQYDARVVESVREAARRVPVFRERLQSARIAVDSLEAMHDLDALPILTKDELLAQQRVDPPFGGWVSPVAKIRRVFQSPGPIYEPQLEGSDPWRSRWALEAAGFGPADTVLNCFGYHLTPAGAMFEEGCFALGAAVVPAGIGSKDLQVGIIRDLNVTAYTGLPSYLKTLIDRYDELDLPANQWQLRRASVSAEPLSDALRAELNRRVPDVLTSYGTAETGLLGYEDRPGEGMRIPKDVVVQICDLDTGHPITSGEGQVVVTVLRPDYPLVRFGTGDISAWMEGPDGDPRLVGILGRVGQAIKIRGMFLHPAQAKSVLQGIVGLERFRFIVERTNYVDQLRCEVLAVSDVDTAAVVESVRDQINAALRFRCEVNVVASLPDDAAIIEDRRAKP